MLSLGLALHILMRSVAVATLFVATNDLAPRSSGIAPGHPTAGGNATSQDSLATLRLLVRRDSATGRPIDGVIIQAGATVARTSATGALTLRLAAGPTTVRASSLGLRPASATLSLRAGLDTAITLVLVEGRAELEGMVVNATRGERRVEDSPLRVELIDEEEIAEKVAMTPGDIAMMLNETSGLRVQTTNPSLGGANVRVQGLRGRYALILSDGLPLFGAQAGGLGLLQIPPIDLGRVEVIKGSASALYGSSALGGMINLVSRRPGDGRKHTVLLNQTSRGGTDAVAFASAPVGERWGYTFLAGGHRQSQRDLDADGWTDMPGYERLVVRPRLFRSGANGSQTFLTAGATWERRNGGALPGVSVPGAGAFTEALGTRRLDIGGLSRAVVGDSGIGAAFPWLAGSIITARGSAMQQRHGHLLGPVREEDTHHTAFAELTVAVPRPLPAGGVTYVMGAAFQREGYEGRSVAGFDYAYTIPALFAQVDADAAPWLSLAASARLDAHSDYGTVLNPRVSVLLRPFGSEGNPGAWTARLSAGTGSFAPTPFTEETEATGLAPLVPLAGLAAERAASGSIDLGGGVDTPLGALEVNGTAFGSRVRHPLQLTEVTGATPTGAQRVRLVNAPMPTRTWGGELLARLVRALGEGEGEGGDTAGAGASHGARSEGGGDAAAEGHAERSLRITASYTWLRSTECDPVTIAGRACARRDVPLTPRHAAGVVTSVEEEGRSRVGLELYYTGRQSLDQNPYRSASRPYLLVGLLGERAFDTPAGTARLFLNLENLTNVRQTRHDPLLLPTRGAGGRWTTDAWTELVGFTANTGIRFTF